jgi:hypothetical protein
MEYQWAHTRVSAIFLEYFFLCFFFFTVLEKLFLEIEKKSYVAFLFSEMKFYILLHIQ